MKIVIIGAGFTGVQLARRLINGKNDVVLIDNDEEIVRHASNRLDCDVICADGNSLETLENAGIAKADALVCVTSNDEVNMITCSLVDSVYPDLLKIARVRNYAYYTKNEDATRRHSENFTVNHRPLYGIDYMVHPDVEAAEAVVHAIEHGAVTDSIQFDNAPYELLRITVEKDSKFDGVALQNIRKFTDKRFLVAYLESGGNTSLPSGSTILRAGDCVGILMERANLSEFLGLCGAETKDVRKIALVGAGRIGTIVAEKLIHTERRNIFTKMLSFRKKVARDFIIVDSDETLAKAAAERFPNAKVFRADLTDEAFLKEEGLNKVDLVICATHNYEMNIVLAAYLESLGVQNSISIVSSSAFGDIARKIGIEVAVPIRDAVIDSIMSHLHGKSVTGIHTVNDGTLEIAEITITENSAVTGKMLKDISEPGKFLILMGMKKNTESYTIFGGMTVLDAGDKIVLITTSADNQHVLEKFGAKI